MASLPREWVEVREQVASDFERLFLAEYSRVVAIAYRILGDSHSAEDVAQEVFTAFYRSHEASAPYAAAWLYRAATHTALNVIRGDRRRQRREERDAVQGQRVIPGADTGDPQQALVEAEQRTEVRAALARLPEKSASVLALRYSGLSYAEIAAALGVGVGQIGTLLRRAEVALRKEMIHVSPR